MTIPQLLITLALAWLAIVGLVRLIVVPILARGPDGDPVKGLIWWIARVYCRLWHRPAYTGTDILPRTHADHDGLIVVSNHTGAVDALLIQSRSRFFIRWMMAADMMKPSLEWLWRLDPIIPVARDGRDTGPLRDAIRHIRKGGAVGIFPEGRITMPPREIRPFLAGVGLIVVKTRAPVLVVWVSGTPDTNKLGEALATRSHARVAFLEIMTFPGETDADVVADRLRRRIADASGWPLNEEVLPPGGSTEDEDTRESGLAA